MISKFSLVFCVTALFQVHNANAQEDEFFCFDPNTCCQGVPDTTSLADWDNCNTFYLCFGGIASSASCTNADKPNYNPETRQCTEEVEGCVGGTRAPIEETSTTPNSVTTTTNLPETSTTEKPGNGNCTEGGAYYIPYPGDCKKYMICSNGILLPDVKECPPGTLFDPDLGDCNLEFLVECLPLCPDSETINLPHEKNCSLYWICSMGNATLKQCLPGLVFDSKLGTCNIEELVLCPNLCPVDGVANLPHSKNCSLYWLCTFGEPTMKQCAPELLFDPVLGQCNLAEQVNCGGISYSTGDDNNKIAPIPSYSLFDAMEDDIDDDKNSDYTDSESEEEEFGLDQEIWNRK